MDVVVDLVDGAVRLEGWGAFGSFAVRALPAPDSDADDPGALGALAAALSLHDVGLVEPGGDVLAPPPAVRRLAEEAATAEGLVLDAEWEEGFEAMVEYARGMGWVSDDGALRAHVVWERA